METEKIEVVCKRMSDTECPCACPLSHDAYTNSEPGETCDKFNIKQGDVVIMKIKRGK